MTRRNKIEVDNTLAERLHEQSRERFADWRNLPKPRWRDALRALAAPAERVHSYRNLHSRALDAAIDRSRREECR